MLKKTGKRLLSALLCATLLACSVLSVSAEQLPGTVEGVSFSQHSSTENLITFEPHAIIHGGQRYTKVYITIPNDAKVMRATVTRQHDPTFMETITFNGNSALYGGSGAATQSLYFDIILSLPDESIHFERSVNSFNYMCGVSHERTSRCYSYDPK